MSTVRSPKSGRQIKVGGKAFNDLLQDPKYRSSLLAEVPSSPTSSRLRRQRELDGDYDRDIETLPDSPNSSLSDYDTPTNPKYEDVRMGHRLDINGVADEHLDEILSMPIFDVPTLEKTLEITKQPARRAAVERMIQEKSGRRSPTRGWAARSPTRGRERHQLKKECGNKCFLLPGKEKFPICPSPRVTGGKSTCEIDCGGVQAAYNRARQWKYDEVADKAEKILEKCQLPVSPRRAKAAAKPKLQLPTSPIMKQLPQPARAASNYSPLSKKNPGKKKLTWREPLEEVNTEVKTETKTPGCGCGK